jgi:hypothetical protein
MSTETINAGSDGAIDGSDGTIDGSDSTINVASGNNTVTVNGGSQDTIIVGNGTDTLTVNGGTQDGITVGNGNDTAIVTGGSNNTITAGNGTDIVVASGDHNDAITLGMGNDAVYLGDDDTLSMGKGSELAVIPASQPTETTVSSITVVEDTTVSLASQGLSVGATALGFGFENISGFRNADQIEFTTAQFANFAAVMADATQVGANTVITDSASDTITLENVAKSSLSANNFLFVNAGSLTGIVTVTITGLPTDLGNFNGGTYTAATGTWTGTAAQFNALTFSAGEQTSALLTVTTTDTATGYSVSENIALTVTLPSINLSVSVVGGGVVQQGQTLVASATTNDTDDPNVQIAYQWQSSTDGQHWTPVPATAAGNFNSGIPSSFYQLSEGDEGKQFRVIASFTDDGQVVSTASAPTVQVADVTPEITVPFSYAVDNLSITKNGTPIYNNNFSQAPITSPPDNGTPIVFITQGSTWTEGSGKAIASSAGVAANPNISGSVFDLALLNTNTDPTSDNGLKEDADFTVSSTFDLVAPATGSYGMELTDGTSTHGVDQLVRVIVTKDHGNTVVELVQRNLTASPQTSNILGEVVLTPAELASDNQISFQLTHAANTQQVAGTFELLHNGVVDTGVGTVTLGTSPIFTDGVDWTRVDVGAFTSTGVGLNVASGQSPLVGQTLTASASTNDSEATIHYHWEKSSSSSFGTFTTIGTDSASYVVQDSDAGSFIRVVATTSDPDNSQTAAATSAVTGTVDGFTGFSGGTLNGNYSPGPQISNGTALKLTNGGGNEYGTWFNNNTWTIGTFTASFDYQANGGADGMAFILEDSSAGSNAIGGPVSLYGGSGLGYQPIAPSAAVEFNIYGGHTRGTNFATDGSVGNYNSTGNVAFWNGDETSVNLSYNGSVLTEQLTDLVNHATYVANYGVNLASVLGSGSAYVGFSGGTGSFASVQTVSNVTFVDGDSGNSAPPPALTVDDGAALEIGSAAANAVTFASASGTLQLDQSQVFSGTIAGFGGQNQIDLGDVGFSAAATLSYAGSAGNPGGTLTVSDGTNTASLALIGQYAAASFAAASDGHGGTLITDTLTQTPQSSLAQPHA